MSYMIFSLKVSKPKTCLTFQFFFALHEIQVSDQPIDWRALNERTACKAFDVMEIRPSWLTIAYLFLAINMNSDENSVGPYCSLSDFKSVPFVVFKWFNGVKFVFRAVHHNVDFFCQFSECYERKFCAASVITLTTIKLPKKNTQKSKIKEYK